MQVRWILAQSTLTGVGFGFDLGEVAIVNHNTSNREIGDVSGNE